MRRERLCVARRFFPSPSRAGLTCAAPTELTAFQRKSKEPEGRRVTEWQRRRSEKAESGMALLFGCEGQRRGAIQKRRPEAIRSSGRASGTKATGRGKGKRAKASGLKT